MAEHRNSSGWDVQGLAIGLAIGFLGVVFLLGREGGDLRPAHLLGVVVLAIGAAYLVDAVDRNWRSSDAVDDRDRIIDLP